jgi:hypothetical protein
MQHAMAEVNGKKRLEIILGTDGISCLATKSEKKIMEPSVPTVV